MTLQRVFVALTGASGSVYGLRLVEQLCLNGIAVTFTASCSGTLVCREETGLDLSGDPDVGEWSIRCKDVYKRLGGTPVLNGLNVAFPEDTITVVLGPSGTGKSVLIKHMIGLMFPDSGDIIVKVVNANLNPLERMPEGKGSHGSIPPGQLCLRKTGEAITPLGLEANCCPIFTSFHWFLSPIVSPRFLWNEKESQSLGHEKMKVNYECSRSI